LPPRIAAASLRIRQLDADQARSLVPWTKSFSPFVGSEISASVNNVNSAERAAVRGDRRFRRRRQRIIIAKEIRAAVWWLVRSPNPPPARPPPRVLIGRVIRKIPLGQLGRFLSRASGEIKSTLTTLARFTGLPSSSFSIFLGFDICRSAISRDHPSAPFRCRAAIFPRIDPFGRDAPRAGCERGLKAQRAERIHGRN